jgi:membrane associated rhomboid family serine protease
MAMASIFEELKQTFTKGSALIKIIFINLAVFILYSLIYLVLVFSKTSDSVNVTEWFAVPAYLPHLLLKPWTLLTYMFYHEDFLHILFNMLWLFWFGKIFLYFFDDRKLISIYLLGGFAGAIFYIAAFNFIPYFHPVLPFSAALGASAAVMAIVFAVSLYAPDFKVNMLFFGEVKLVYIALVSAVIDVIMIPHGNAGGHIAHLGGAFLGYVFAIRYRSGNDITRGFSKFIDLVASVFKPRRLKVAHKKPVNDMDYKKTKVDMQNEIDRILDKISKGGYESLTKDEKETLFKMGTPK